MIDNLPNWTNVLFIITAFITVIFFYFSNSKPTKVIIIILVWGIVQSLLAYSGFYQNTKSIPPRFILVLLPTILFMIYGLLPRQRNYVLERHNINISTFLHSVRIPVELVLFPLFINKMIPELMTFEGRNFDILAGITSPIIGYFFLKKKLSGNVMIIWNVICLGLVLFILFNGVLSVETPFQQFGFEQPNRALFYFPFILLPAVIVPIVIYTHIIDIIKLRQTNFS